MKWRGAVSGFSSEGGLWVDIFSEWMLADWLLFFPPFGNF